MHVSERFLVLVILAVHFVVLPTFTQVPLAQSLQLSSAKTICFKNQTGSDGVGRNALTELKKWGRFRIVQDQRQADLILLLSREQYQGPGSASGRTSDLDHPDVSHIPNWDRQKQTKYAYLTVIDPNTGSSLWSAEHVWGGLLTGFNSVGERLVKEFEKETKK